MAVRFEIRSVNYAHESGAWLGIMFTRTNDQLLESHNTFVREHTIMPWTIEISDSTDAYV